MMRDDCDDLDYGQDRQGGVPAWGILLGATGGHDLCGQLPPIWYLLNRQFHDDRPTWTDGLPFLSLYRFFFSFPDIDHALMQIVEACKMVSVAECRHTGCTFLVTANATGLRMASADAACSFLLTYRLPGPRGILVLK